MHTTWRCRRATEPASAPASAPATAPGPDPRRGARTAVVLFALLGLVATGCSDLVDDLTDRIDGILGDDEVADSADGQSDAADIDRTPVADDGVPDCEAYAYPCTWDEVGGDRLAESLTLAEELDAIATAGWDPEAVGAALEARDDVAEAVMGVEALRFRLEGSRPVWVFTDDAFVREDADSDTEPLAAGHPHDHARSANADGHARSANAHDHPTPADALLDPGDPASTIERAAFASSTSTPSPQDPTIRPTPAAVVGDDPDQKRALILSVYEYQPLHWATQEIAAILESTRGYAGNVEFIANPDPSEAPGADLDLSDPDDQPDAPDAPDDPDADPEEGIQLELEEDFEGYDTRIIGPEHFTGWDAYDVVYLATHGQQLCTDERCWSALGLGAPAIDQAAGLTEQDFRNIFGYTDEPGVTIAYYRNEVMAVIDGDWLAAQYAGGLQDTIVYFQACAGASGPVLPTGLSGDRSVFLGWSEITLARDAGPAAIHFFEEATDRGVASTTAYDEVVDAGLHRSEGTRPWTEEIMPGEKIFEFVDGQLEPVDRETTTEVDAELLHFAPGTDLRLREVIELQHPDTGAMLTGGEMVPLGSDADGHTLPIRVEVDGVLDGQASDFEVEVIVNGVTLVDDWRLDADGDLVDVEAWRIEDELGLPIGMDETTELTIDARVTLPEGGISQHVVTINSAGYEFHLEAEMDTTAGAMTDLARVEGSFPLSFDADLDDGDGAWSGQAPADWLTYTYGNSICAQGTRELSTTSDVEVARAALDPEAGTVELDLRWREDVSGPSVPCGADGSMSAPSEHEVAVTSLVLGLGGGPGPGGGAGTQPDQLLEFVGPDTVRFDTSQPGGGFSPGDTAGSFVFEAQRVVAGDGGSTTATFRLELRPITEQ